MTIFDLKVQCRTVLRSLVNHGSEVCGQFKAEQERTYFCETCGYTQYVHLCKQVAEIQITDLDL